MQAKWIKRGVAAGVLLLLVVAAVYALWPQPVGVDIAVIDKGQLDVTIDEEGVARIRNLFRVSAPIGGRLDRLPLEVGDKVVANVTEVARIRPTDPSFLDVRTRRELEAALAAARAGVNLAQAQLTGAMASEHMAQSDLERAERLAKTGTIPGRSYEKAASDLATARAAVAELNAALALRQSELDSASARLIEPGPMASAGATNCCLRVNSPVSGTVVRLITENEQVVAAGTPLLEVGDPHDLVLVVHILSSDAVGIPAGAAAIIDGWGGPTLAARVERIDPAAYTKVSALGIEEQRVDATLLPTEPRETLKALGHEFRIMAHISVWRGDVVRVPLAAIFRRGSDWVVYRAVNGRASATTVVLGHRNADFAEVSSGLAAGDVVVLHPTDRVVDSVKIAVRE